MRKAHAELDITMSYTKWWTQYNRSEETKKSEVLGRPYTCLQQMKEIPAMNEPSLRWEALTKWDTSLPPTPLHKVAWQC